MEVCLGSLGIRGDPWGSVEVRGGRGDLWGSMGVRGGSWESVGRLIGLLVELASG